MFRQEAYASWKWQSFSSRFSLCTEMTMAVAKLLLQYAMT